MTRDEFEHTVRAAAAVLDEDEVLVIGSQAIHAAVKGRLPRAATRSVEVDLVPFGDPEGVKADLVDGSIGEASMFHEHFGVYAQGVSETTATLPDGWRDRLVRYETPGTNGVVAWCLEPHDLWVSKAVAGREKDLEFCREVLRSSLVKKDTLRRRLDETPGLEPEVRALAEGLLA